MLSNQAGLNERVTNMRATKEYQDLMEQLITIQNTERFENQDIVSFTGFFDELSELQNHVDRYQAIIEKGE